MKFPYKNIAAKTLEEAIDINRTLGHGFIDSIYENALVIK